MDNNRPDATDDAKAPQTRRSLCATLGLGSVLGMAVWGTGCSTRWWEPLPPVPAPRPQAPGTQPVPAPAPTPNARPATTSRTWDEYRMQAARRMVQLNPGRSYLSTPPNPLLAIPVLEVELHADGSVSSIRVQRHPTQATDTVQLAIDAVRRAAPFGPVSHLPRPWKFSEVFLFDDERRFKPRSLD